MNLFYIIWIFALLVWFIGIGIVAYHVTRYSAPKDKLVVSFFFLIAIAGAALFWAISFVGELL